MSRLRLTTSPILFLSNALTAQARISINGPEQSSATAHRVIDVLSIELGGPARSAQNEASERHQ